MRYQPFMSAGKRFAFTVILAVAAFMLLAGPSCQFGGSDQPAQAPAAAPAPAPAPVAAAPAPAPAPQIDTSNLQVKTLTLTDRSGNARATLATDESGAPSLTLFDANGGARSRLSLDGKGNPYIDLYNSKGDVISSYWVENDAPFLTYNDKTGQAVTIIPKEAAAPVRPAVSTPRPVATNPTPSPAGNGNMTVYVINGRPNYHLRTCPRLDQHGKHPMTLADAVANGYQPCKVCRPPLLIK